MLPRTFPSFVNHLLLQQSWARERLAAHAGSRLCLRTRPLFADVNLSITDEGLVTANDGAAAPDLLVTLRPAAIPLVLGRHPNAIKNIDLMGNAGLAAAVQELFQRLEWDLEEDLARVFGDVAAHRMATTGRSLVAWQRDAFERAAQNFAEYLTEENPMIAGRAEFYQLRLDIQDLGKDLDRVEARFDVLARRLRTVAG